MMLNITANPDVETLKMVLIIAGIALGFSFTIIGYFVKKHFSDNEKEGKDQVYKISKMVDTLGKAVDNLKSIVDVLKAQQDERDPRTERRLGSLEKKSEEHENRLYIVETRCTMIQKAKEEKK